MNRLVSDSSDSAEPCNQSTFASEVPYALLAACGGAGTVSSQARRGV